MYSVYVLKSEKNNKSYVGHTGDLNRRLLEHNRGDNYYTKRHRPWIVVYKEDYDNLEEAIRREKFLKSTSGRRFLKEIFN